jgi:hypothetical protein
MTQPDTQTGTAGGTPPTETPKPAARPTRYHVLRRVGGGAASSPSQVEETWAIVAKDVEAQSGEAAKRKIGANLTTTGDDSVTLVAIPSRSWQPQTASVQTKTQLILS